MLLPKVTDTSCLYVLSITETSYGRERNYAHKNSVFCHTMTVNICTLLSLSFVTLVTSTDPPCRYPSDMYDVTYNWRIMSPDYDLSLQHYRRKVTFDGPDMRVDYITDMYQLQRSGRRITYTCEAMLPGNKFIAMVTEKGNTERFTCIQFLMRSRNVVQWKMGAFYGWMSRDLCDNLFIVDSPLVYFDDGKYGFWSEKRNQDSSYHPCPLEGGYIISQWYNESGKGKCRRDHLAPISIKLENECESGEGLSIIGGHINCPTVYEGHPLFCLASWKDDHYTYMIIHREHMDFTLPCIRYPTDHGNRFTAFLFIDGVCDSTDDIQHSRKYRRLELDRHVTSGGDICHDDGDACEEFLPPLTGCEGSWASFCRYTCRLCRFKRPWTNVTIPTVYQGHWFKDTYSQGHEILHIDEHFIRIPSLGSYRIFGESRCVDRGQTRGMGHRVREFVFIQVFHNGCSPRMTFVQVTRRSPTVISIRLSLPQTVDWQIFRKQIDSQTPDFGILACSSGQKYRKPSVNIKETFRPLPYGWFNLVSEDSVAQTVPCAELTFNRVTLILSPGAACTGDVIKLADDSFQIDVDVCSSEDISFQFMAFQCLAVFKESTGRKKESRLMQFMVTRSPKTPSSIMNDTYICWAFSLIEPGLVYWFRASDCDGNAEVYFFEYGGKIKHSIATLQTFNTVSFAAEPSGFPALSVGVVSLTSCLWLRCY